MVVCKCRKATKLYCFVHKTPLCLDCICGEEHLHCVVGLYSEWVNDGDYDWPPKCTLCSESMEEDPRPTIRLGCLHVFHADCFEKHLSSYPSYTAPAGFTCPNCKRPIWPPKSQKDAASTLYTQLRATLAKTPAAAGVLLAPPSTPGANPPPPTAFSTPPLVHGTVAAPFGESAANGLNNAGGQHTGSGLEGGHGAPAGEKREGGEGMANHALPHGSGSATEEGAADAGAAGPPHGQPSTGSQPLASPTVNSPSRKASSNASSAVPGAIPRKPSFRPGERAIDIAEEYAGDSRRYADDEDGSERKYARRGPLYMQVLRHIGSFWAPALQALPVKAPSRRDEREGGGGNPEEAAEGSRARRRHSTRRSVMDPRKLLLGLAILSCIGTVLLLYYRLAVSSLSSGGNEGTGHEVGTT
eukprot:TRINITY_DN26495_c0_g1_i1.p1 TRINITY_DN26495_c0_g1~~TRINITY_DN26495_c0_g1_i1.p1  ORF type:complete len:414 (-),score=77.54 TRINITY_DN26495_c0_g1_i1:712-1953(-)